MSKPLLGSGERFKQLTHKLEGQKGVYNPKGLAAEIGRKKYGNKKMNAMAKAGRNK